MFVDTGFLLDLFPLEKKTFDSLKAQRDSIRCHILHLQKTGSTNSNVSEKERGFLRRVLSRGLKPVKCAVKVRGVEDTHL